MSKPDKESGNNINQEIAEIDRDLAQFVAKYQAPEHSPGFDARVLAACREELNKKLTEPGPATRPRRFWVFVTEILSAASNIGGQKLVLASFLLCLMVAGLIYAIVSRNRPDTPNKIVTVTPPAPTINVPANSAHSPEQPPDQPVAVGTEKRPPKVTPNTNRGKKPPNSNGGFATPPDLGLRGPNSESSDFSIDKIAKIYIFSNSSAGHVAELKEELKREVSARLQIAVVENEADADAAIEVTTREIYLISPNGKQLLKQSYPDRAEIKSAASKFVNSLQRAIKN